MFQGVDAQPFAGAQQNHFVSYLNARDAGYIDQREVHGDAAYDGSVMAANDDPAAIAELAVIAVSIADRQHRNVRWSLRHVGCAVAQRLVRTEIAQRKD